MFPLSALRGSLGTMPLMQKKKKKKKEKRNRTKGKKFKEAEPEEFVVEKELD